MSGQVSVWVPIVVALLGLAGVIGGQIINAWREDRRWQREQRREDIRWQRQKLTENAKLRLEHASQWRETKIRIYGELIAALGEQKSLRILITNAVVAKMHKVEIGGPDLKDLLQQEVPAMQATQKLVAEATLVAGDEMLEHIRVARELAFELYFRRGKSVEHIENNTAGLVASHDQIAKDLLEIARRELAVSDIEIDDSDHELAGSAL